MSSFSLEILSCRSVYMTWINLIVRRVIYLLKSISSKVNHIKTKYKNDGKQ